MAEGRYVCTGCGARYDALDPPCRKCAGEEFAEVVSTDSGGTQQVQYICRDCGRAHPRNNPPCKTCGGMDFETVRGENGADTVDTRLNDPTNTNQSTGQLPAITSSAGDVLFNKSLTRQLIDLQLLILTGFTWLFFIFTEFIYHRWRQSKGEAHKSQYHYSGAKGEGPITKIAKVLFWIQWVGIVIVVGLFVLLLLA